MADRVGATEQERLERLRGLLSGQRTQDRAARALTLGQGGSGNMLLGALLHGADRLRQGQTPTDLEQILLNAVGAQLSGAETRQWGGVYRELVDAQGRVALLPERITSRPVTQGYSMADLRQDLPRLQADALACPTVQIVSPAVAASGQPEDPAFIEAMAETGFAVTAFADVTQAVAAAGTADAGIGQSGEAPAGGESEDGSRAATTFRMKLEMESFYVNRAVGDQGVAGTRSTGPPPPAAATPARGPPSSRRSSEPSRRATGGTSPPAKESSSTEHPTATSGRPSAAGKPIRATTNGGTHSRRPSTKRSTASTTP